MTPTVDKGKAMAILSPKKRKVPIGKKLLVLAAPIGPPEEAKEFSPQKALMQFVETCSAVSIFFRTALT